MTKICTKCNVAKPATKDFFGHTPSGNFRGMCNTCRNKNSQEYAKKNPRSVTTRSKTRQTNTCRWKPTPKLKQLLFERQAGLCGLCQDVMNPDEVLDSTCLQVDHLTPASKGGTNDKANLVLAHRKCNQEKAGKTFDEYVAWRKHVGLPDLK